MLSIPVAAQAQLELYGKFNKDGSVEPVINYYGLQKVSDKFAVNFFGLVRQKWSQALIGISYLPSNNVTLSAGAGIEHGQHDPRYTASVSVRKNRNAYLLLGELGSGHGNYLYKASIFHKYSDKFTAGVMDWRYHGLGPNFRYTITGVQSTIWLMPAYDHEQKVARCMAGINLQM